MTHGLLLYCSLLPPDQYESSRSNSGVVTDRANLIASNLLQTCFNLLHSHQSGSAEVYTSGEICQKAKVPCANQPNHLAVLENVFGRAYNIPLTEYHCQTMMVL
jgi:hypothetical protein